MTRARGRAALLALVVAPLVAVLLPAAAAKAHPLGLPAFAQVVATSASSVEVRWSAAPDDVAALGRSLGVADVDLLTREQDAALAGSAELAARVERDVVVGQDGQACEPTYVPPQGVVSAGIVVRFDCERPVDRIDVRIALRAGAPL